MQIDPAKTYRATISTNQGVNNPSETIYPPPAF